MLLCYSSSLLRSCPLWRVAICVSLASRPSAHWFLESLHCYLSCPHFTSLREIAKRHVARCWGVATASPGRYEWQSKASRCALRLPASPAASARLSPWHRRSARRTAAPPHRRLPRPPRAHQQLSWREQHHDRHMLLQASPWRPSQEHVPPPPAPPHPPPHPPQARWACWRSGRCGCVRCSARCALPCTLRASWCLPPTMG